MCGCGIRAMFMSIQLICVYVGTYLFYTPNLELVTVYLWTEPKCGCHNSISGAKNNVPNGRGPQVTCLPEVKVLFMTPNWRHESK